jgi:pimeloyl-ACP methyl ester carboxylesterase
LKTKTKYCYLEDPGIYYRKRIIPGKPCLLFFHGVFGTSSAWVPFEKKLKNFSFISPDIRGHGKSFRPKKMKDFIIRKMAEDFFKIIKKEKIKDIIIIGNSYGNFIAFEFMKKHPDYVKKVILISPYDKPDRIKSVRLIKPIAKIICRLNFLFKTDSIGEHFDYYSIFKGKHSGDYDVRRLYPDVMNTGLKSSLCLFYQLFDYSSGNINNKIPILIIHGRKDSIFPIKYIIEMARKMKNTQLKIIENGDHILLLNNLNEVLKIIEDFLSE